ncbi:prephenate dehydratase domain-containing protein [Candidatus Haliotispira prima]|uniref:Prephenate dehydratase n=1 Tax=Candidatus Haliotispira prima TaxID=3034016 RepID=A0ABY8MHU7_9SPIO|nr:prephenate dehydratase domain-containing protein [Candidatus Haliotispira prima]
MISVLESGMTEPQRQISSQAPVQIPLQVAFQGEPGAYSEQALRQFFCSENADAVYPRQEFVGLETFPCADFRRMFEVVQNNEVPFAVVPLENSLAGSIMENYDLLLEYPDLCICGETRLRVSHMLIAAKGSSLSQIQLVRSHPQALAQSRHFLEQHGLEPLANFDTAGSVRELKDRPEAHVAAIAGALAAEIYDMGILARAIESNPHNYTRFAIVSRFDSGLLRPRIADYERQKPGRRFGNKWSICLRLRNFSGSLATALEIFQKYQLDLTKLESRPIMGQPWSYRFYLDTLIAKDMTESREAAFFRELEHISQEYRIIGRYWENLK